MRREKNPFIIWLTKRSKGDVLRTSKPCFHTWGKPLLAYYQIGRILSYLSCTFTMFGYYSPRNLKLHKDNCWSYSNVYASGSQFSFFLFWLWFTQKGDGNTQDRAKWKLLLLSPWLLSTATSPTAWVKRQQLHKYKILTKLKPISNMPNSRLKAFLGKKERRTILLVNIYAQQV